MKAFMKTALADSLESCDAPIIIGEEQSLATVHDSLAAIDETKETVDTDTSEVEETEEVAESLESIAKAIRIKIKDGGLTKDVAQIYTTSIEQLLDRVSVDSSNYVFSAESFSQDRLAVSLEAERSVKEAAKVVSTKVIELSKKLIASTELYIKGFEAVGKGLNDHATSIKTKVKATVVPDDLSSRDMDITPFVVYFHTSGSFDGHFDTVLKKQLAVSKDVSSYTQSSKKVVTDLITAAGKGDYKAGDYIASFANVASKINSVDLPGGYNVAKDEKTRLPKLVTEAKPDVKERTIDLPNITQLASVCDNVIKVADYVKNYAKLLKETEGEIKQLVTAIDKNQQSPEVAAAMGALGNDLSKIIGAVRGIGPDYIRYMAISGKEALNFVNKSIKLYA